jgi:hypothetical protein
MSFSSLSDICANSARSLDRDFQVARVSIEESNQLPNMRLARRIPNDGAAALEFKKCIDIAFPVLELLRRNKWRGASDSANENSFMPSEIESSIAGAVTACSLIFRSSVRPPRRELIWF